MREIKFRAWTGNKMYYDVPVSSVGELNLMSDSPTGNPIMQYIGKKDKNGKEIYEGDILKEGEYGFFEVVWDSLWCKFKLDCSRVCEHIQYPEWNRGVHMEVIGNIYEHPELLK